jgi:hypothetical protein
MEILLLAALALGFAALIAMAFVLRSEFRDRPTRIRAWFVLIGAVCVGLWRPLTELARGRAPRMIEEGPLFLAIVGVSAALLYTAFVVVSAVLNSLIRRNGNGKKTV